MTAISVHLNRMGLSSLRCLTGQVCLFVRSPTLKTATPLQKAFISSKAMRDNSKVKPAPFPYREKKFGFFKAYFDHTTARFDENTKLLVVEGNIAAGKTSFAKALADELDMMYIPEANMDMYFVNDYGYDLRDYKHLLPEAAKPFDVADFYKTPNHRTVANFQIAMYVIRYQQYLDALVHILNTGQGVVMDRCVYSDFCFLETMHKFGYISQAARKAYYEIKKNTIGELLRPHLVIYLDVPVNVIKERIKKRGDEHEVNTNVLATDYLQTLTDVYKYQYLKEVGKHAELLIYDWSNFGEVEVVVEDIERIDFDHFDKYEEKMKDWRLNDEAEWRERRFYYTRQRQTIMNYFNVPILHCPEITIPPEDAKVFWDIYFKIPGNHYETGYNANAGDSGFLLRTGHPSPFK